MRGSGGRSSGGSPRRLLLSDVELNVQPGGALLLRGAAGAGKTALLRTICGVWPMGAGEDAAGVGQGGLTPTAEIAEIGCIPPVWDVHARRAGSPLFVVVPQSAPLRPGLRTSLFEQLVYPLLQPQQLVTAGACDDALVTVGLSELPAKLGGLHTPHSPQEWHAALSPGQRQLLVCARVFVHSPALVLLDEATSAMPAADEARIYSSLRARRIAFVSIGHRTSLEPHHDEILDLSAALLGSDGGADG